MNRRERRAGKAAGISAGGVALGAVQAGLAAHRAGDLAGAAVQYRTALAADANHPDALHLLGLTQAQQGDRAGALDLVRRAVAAAPRNAVFHNSLGNLLREAGQGAAALDSYRTACRLDPRYGEAQYHLGLLLQAQGQLQPAAEALRSAVRLLPAHAEAANNLGVAEAALGRHEAAVAAFTAALRLRPGFAPALANRAASRRALGRLAEAWPDIAAAIALDPAAPRAWFNAGVLAQALGQGAAAQACYRCSLLLAPGNADAWYNLALARKEGSDLAGALAAGQAAAAVAPAHRDALYNLSEVERAAGRDAAAIRRLGWCLALDPADAKARWNRAIYHLAGGDLRQGWQDFAARFAATGYTPRHQQIPAWQDQDPAGRTVLVWPEQGVGDEIVFATCLPDLAARAGTVLLECDPRLASLFHRSYPQVQVRPRGAGPVRADLQLSSGTLAARLRPGLADFPDPAPRLVPDPVRAAHWAQRVAALGPGLKVGLLWRGRLAAADRQSLYVPLPAMAPLLATPGCRFVSLQYGDAEGEIAAWEAAGGTTLQRWPDLDLLDDFEGVAALMSNLDLVIAPGTAAAPLAGALGVRTWVFAGPESWLPLGTDRYPWTPSLRLFRRRAGQDWAPVLAAMAHELGQICRPDSAG